MRTPRTRVAGPGSYSCWRVGAGPPPLESLQNHGFYIQCFINITSILCLQHSILRIRGWRSAWASNFSPKNGEIHLILHAFPSKKARKLHPFLNPILYVLFHVANHGKVDFCITLHKFCHFAEITKSVVLPR